MLRPVQTGPAGATEGGHGPGGAPWASCTPALLTSLRSKNSCPGLGICCGLQRPRLTEPAPHQGAELGQGPQGWQVPWSRSSSGKAKFAPAEEEGPDGSGGPGQKRWRGHDRFTLQGVLEVSPALWDCPWSAGKDGVEC